MKKLITSLACFAMTAFAAFAQEWVDVTDQYVTNPRFDGDDVTTGWEGTGFGAYNPKENAEHYQKTYDTYQHITGLQPGKYRVSVNALYRMGSAANDYSIEQDGNAGDSQIAELYAQTSKGESTTKIAYLSSGKVSASLGGGASGIGNTYGNWWEQTYEYYVPNNMEAADYWFNAGYYMNTIEVEVGNNGELTIGIRKPYTISEDWTCVDNWKLEQFTSDFQHVTGVTLSTTALNMVPWETKRITATVQPDYADNKKIKWTSSDENIVTVDDNGLVFARSTGSAYIRATSVDNPALVKSCRVTVANVVIKASNFVINEIQAANVDMFMDPSFNYGSWIELYNNSSINGSLAGLYITDDENDLTKFQLPETIGGIPAKGFRVLWFDHNGIWNIGEHNQINFKLNYDGGTIIISDGTKIITRQDYPQAISRTSYARTTDGGDEWAVTAEPTPSESNATSNFASTQIEAPIIDKDSHIFSGNLQICVNIPEGATLVYTTDGSTPTLTNGETSATGIFNTDKTATFRFRLFKEGMLPSQVVTRSYILNDKNFELPIISVVGSKSDLYSSDYGVFVKGSKNGRPGAGQNSNCNWNMDWDRPVNFEYIGNEDDGGEYRMLFNQEVDLSRCGGWSRAWTPYSFKLKAAKYYDGLNSLNYPFFPDKPYIKNKTLQIRNGGNDTSARIKDAALQQIISRTNLNIDGQSWVPVLHYINGKFMGVLNMREPNNKHFAYANYGIDTEEMDQFEMSPDSGYVQMTGTKDAFNELCALAENAADEETYEEIKQRLDIDEYINYMAVEFYLAGTDWPQNNIKGFRDVNNGKFRFVLFDLDGTFGTNTPFTEFSNKRYRTSDQLYGAYWDGTSINGQRNSIYIEMVDLFINLLKNEEFKKQFIDHYCVIAGSVFTPERCQEIIMDVANKMAPSMSISNGYFTSSPWGTANDLIGRLTNERINSQTNHMASYMKLTNAKQAASISSNVEGAKLCVNDFEIPTGNMNGYLYSPVVLKANPMPGFKFVGWAGEVTSTTQETTLINMGDAWDYYDGGSLDGDDWTSASYNSKKWNSGKTPIGYGKDQQTETAANLTTYYFRKNITLKNNPDEKATFTLNYTLDDGMVLYVNGYEVTRDNMPSGNVSYNTFASTYAYNNPNTGTTDISSSYFQKGNNIIAVEVHNNSNTSTDILWDAELLMSEEVLSGTDYVSTDEEYTIPSSGSINLTAMYEKMTYEEMAKEGITAIRINEVSAANSMYINDYFKKNDWIELVNTTDTDIDIAGAYISDNREKPQKYQIPTDNVALNTIVPAHGYKVIWCDKLNNMAADIHTSFKLAAEGGDVLFSCYDNQNSLVWSDTITYDVHLGNQSFGRYPDGTNDTYVMSQPTIGKTNIITSYDTLYIAPIIEPEPDAIHSHVKEGGISIAYVEGVVNAKSEDARIVALEVFGTSGMQVARNATVRNADRFATINVAHLPKGIYMARVTTADGDYCTVKFVIR